VGWSKHKRSAQLRINLALKLYFGLNSDLDLKPKKVPSLAL
jgi:hypothetical protein